MDPSLGAQQAVLGWLGLKPLEADVLLAVMAAEEVTSASLRSLTGSSVQSITAAVDRLVRLGLLDRVYQTRPQLLYVHPRAQESLAELVAAAERSHAERKGDLAVMAEAVGVATQRRIERGVPPGGTADHALNPRGRSSHDEVLPAVQAEFGTTGRALLYCPTRLLVTDASEQFDLEHLMRRQAAGSEVRTLAEPLPLLAVLDGNRVATWASTPDGRRRVWSRDQRHVLAAQELFEAWWSRAGPGLVTPTPPTPPEPEWDVDEWDPADL